MDLQLQQFVDSTATLADLRNLDANNPVSFDLEYPTTASLFTVIAAVNEPSYMGIPINSLWVVINASSQYHKQVLKLKSITSPAVSGITGAIQDAGFSQSWVQLQSYSELFTDGQYYSTGGGVPGPQGPQGIAGLTNKGVWSATATYNIGDVITSSGSAYSSLTDSNLNNAPGPLSTQWTLLASKGDTPTVDYEYIINQVIQMMTATLVSIQLSGIPAQSTEGTNYPLSVIATYSDNTTKDVTAQSSYSVNPTAAGTVTNQTYHSALVTTDTPAIITATYTEAGVTKTSQLNTNVRNKVPASLAINGPSTVAEGGTANYTATVTYNTGDTAVVAVNLVTWGLSSGAMGSISTAGLFTAAQVGSDLVGQVTGQYTESGVTVNGNKSVTVSNTVAASHAKFGVGAAVPVSGYDQTWFDALQNTSASSVLTQSFTLDSGASGSGIYMYFAYPKVWTTAKFEDAGSPGFFGGWDGAKGDPFDSTKFGPVEVTLTVGGVTQIWYIYRTDYDGLGVTTWNVSPG